MGPDPMDKKKSLGSTPIGYNVNPTSYSFIRDIGVAKDNEPAKDEALNGNMKSVASSKSGEEEKENQSVEKKVVSYYLDVDLVSKLKKMADEKGSYYSTVVSKAIRAWIDFQEK
jgi:hypothetical protein